MAYCKDDVIDLLKLKSSAVLREVRNLALNELVAILPEYATREMRFRKKDDYMIQDIYVITYSVISRLAEKTLYKSFKPVSNVDNLDTSDLSLLDDEETQEKHDYQSLIRLCLSLLERCSKLEDIVKEQDLRLLALESQQTKSKIDKVTNTPPRPMDQPEGGEPVEPRKTHPGAQVAPSQAGDGCQQRYQIQMPKAGMPQENIGDAKRTRNAIPGPQRASSATGQAGDTTTNKQKDGPVTVPKQRDGPVPDTVQNQPGGSERRFQHAASERRNILQEDPATTVGSLTYKAHQLVVIGSLLLLNRNQGPILFILVN